MKNITFSEQDLSVQELAEKLKSIAKDDPIVSQKNSYSKSAKFGGLKKWAAAAAVALASVMAITPVAQASTMAQNMVAQTMTQTLNQEAAAKFNLNLIEAANNEIEAALNQNAFQPMGLQQIQNMVDAFNMYKAEMNDYTAQMPLSKDEISYVAINSPESLSDTQASYFNALSKSEDLYQTYSNRLIRALEQTQDAELKAAPALFNKVLQNFQGVQDIELSPKVIEGAYSEPGTLQQLINIDQVITKANFMQSVGDNEQSDSLYDQAKLAINQLAKEQAQSATQSQRM